MEKSNHCKSWCKAVSCYHWCESCFLGPASPTRSLEWHWGVLVGDGHVVIIPVADVFLRVMATTSRVCFTALPSDAVMPRFNVNRWLNQSVSRAINYVCADHHEELGAQLAWWPRLRPVAACSVPSRSQQTSVSYHCLSFGCCGPVACSIYLQRDSL